MGIIRALQLLTLIYALHLCECRPYSQQIFSIDQTWDSNPLDHDPITITFSSGPGGLLMQVLGPFYNDPPSPAGYPGQAFPQLWNYEVVEAFFLDSTKENYLEVVLCPHGQHLIRLLSGVGQSFTEQLPIVFNTNITGDRWWGEAVIPWTYFPPNVNKINAYAIHGSGEKRTYEALHPVPKDEIEEGQKPNTHLLQYFKDFRLQSIMGEDWVQPESELWKGKESQLMFYIGHTWDSGPLDHEPIKIKFSPAQGGLKMQVFGTFFNDPAAPAGPPGHAFPGLWDYEVVESFFLDSTTENYLEVELCPHGQHLILLLSGVHQAFAQQLPMMFTTAISGDEWTGEAIIPWAYFPPNVNKMNSYAIHGSGENRIYEALYPVPEDQLEDGQKPNFHLLKYFEDFRLQSIMGEDWVQEESHFWEGKGNP